MNKIKTRITKIEDQVSVTEVPAEDIIKVITGMTPDEIQALRTELRQKYGQAANKILFVNTGVPRSFLRSK